jgi:hypothetical protein
MMKPCNPERSMAPLKKGLLRGNLRRIAYPLVGLIKIKIGITIEIDSDPDSDDRIR